MAGLVRFCGFGLPPRVVTTVRDNTRRNRAEPAGQFFDAFAVPSVSFTKQSR